MGSSVQRGQTAVAVAVAVAVVLVVVGQYFRVTFHGRRGLSARWYRRPTMCRVAPILFFLWCFLVGLPSNDFAE